MYNIIITSNCGKHQVSRSGYKSEAELERKFKTSSEKVGENIGKDFYVGCKHLGTKIRSSWNHLQRSSWADDSVRSRGLRPSFKKAMGQSGSCEAAENLQGLQNSVIRRPSNHHRHHANGLESHDGNWNLNYEKRTTRNSLHSCKEKSSRNVSGKVESTLAAVNKKQSDNRFFPDSTQHNGYKRHGAMLPSNTIHDWTWQIWRLSTTEIN